MPAELGRRLAEEGCIDPEWVEGPETPATPAAPPAPNLSGGLAPSAGDCPTQEEQGYLLFVQSLMDRVDRSLWDVLDHLVPLAAGGPASDEALGRAWFEQGAGINERLGSAFPPTEVIADTPRPSPATEEIHQELLKLEEHFHSMHAAYGSVVEEGYDEDYRIAAWKAAVAEVDATYLVLSTMGHRTVSFCQWA